MICFSAGVFLVSSCIWWKAVFCCVIVVSGSHSSSMMDDFAGVLCVTVTAANRCWVQSCCTTSLSSARGLQLWIQRGFGLLCGPRRARLTERCLNRSSSALELSLLMSPLLCCLTDAPSQSLKDRSYGFTAQAATLWPWRVDSMWHRGKSCCLNGKRWRCSFCLDKSCQPHLRLTPPHPGSD